MIDNLFDYVGVKLPRTNLIISDIVITEIARKASEKISNFIQIEPELLHTHIYSVLQDYFNPDQTTIIPNDHLKTAIITAIRNYLIMQDAFECQSSHKVNAIAIGLYENVIVHLESIIRNFIMTEIELNNKPINCTLADSINKSFQLRQG